MGLQRGKNAAKNEKIKPSKPHRFTRVGESATELS